MKMILLPLLPLVIVADLYGQTSTPNIGAASTESSVSTYHRLEAKNRARTFSSEVPSPAGVHYVYLSDADLKATTAPAKEIQVRQNSRAVVQVVKTFASGRVELSGESNSLGTVHLDGTLSGGRRHITVSTSVDLNRPLRIRVRKRSLPNPD